MKKTISACLFALIAASILTSCTGNTSLTTMPEGSPASASTPTITLPLTPSQVPPSTPAITPAEKFISTMSEEQLNSIMNKVIRLLALNIPFVSTDTLTSSELFQFYIGVQNGQGMEQWYNKEEKIYFVPVKNVIAVLNQYLEGYVFEPNKVFSSSSYNKEKDAIALSTYGVDFTDRYKIENAKAITDNLVEIVAAFYDSKDNNSDYPIYRTRLMLKITDTGYYYRSLVKNLVRIDLATDELLDKYDSFYEYINDKDGAEILIWSDTKIKDFAFISVNFIENKSSFNSCLHAGNTLFSIDELSPEKPFVVKLLIPGTVPAYGISLTDEKGVRRFYTIDLSGKGDGPLYHLNEFKNANGK